MIFGKEDALQADSRIEEHKDTENLRGFLGFRTNNLKTCGFSAKRRKLEVSLFEWCVMCF